MLLNLVAMSTAYAETILDTFAASHTGLAEFFVHIIQNHYYHSHPLVQELFSHCDDVCEAFAKQKQCCEAMTLWTCNTAKVFYTKEVKALAQKDNGWHFSAHTADMDQLTHFEIEDKAKDIQKLSPSLWDLVYLLLGGDLNNADKSGMDVGPDRSTLPAVARDQDEETNGREHNDEVDDKMALINIVHARIQSLTYYAQATDTICKETSCSH